MWSVQAEPLSAKTMRSQLPVPLWVIIVAVAGPVATTVLLATAVGMKTSNMSLFSSPTFRRRTVPSTQACGTILRNHVADGLVGTVRFIL